jgi:transcriptional regulator with PAS, ATPase and Fis domain
MTVSNMKVRQVGNGRRPLRAAAISGLSAEFVRNSDAILRLAMKSLFERLDGLCEGALAVDESARIVWINAKYAAVLGLTTPEEALGREVEELIPNSLMREVVTTGRSTILDIMELRGQSVVVTRMPLQDESGRIIGALGFVLYDRLDYLKPLVAKFARLQEALADANRRLVENRRPQYTLSSFLGNSASCVEVKRQVRRAAMQNTTVLLSGETGTGKELLAHAMHAASDRARCPFVAVNVAAIPETLLEVEFFGAAPGAYTGLDRKGRDGKFKIADGGTLFLDEIGDMPLALQVKFLRVLQDQEIEALGSNRLFKVDVRIIAASSVDLKRLVDEGRFRPDLYYRLNVLPIAVPPLRERLSALEVLWESILEQIAARTGLRQCEIPLAGIAALAQSDWPGNVRELRNVLERATMLSENLRLTADDITRVLPVRPVIAQPRELVRTTFAEALRDFERSMLRDAMDACGNRATEAAKRLGMSRATFYKKLARSGLASRNSD